MKKIVIPLTAVLLLLSACQTGKVTTALNMKDNGNLVEAVETINAAVDPQTKMQKKPLTGPIPGK